MKPLSPNRCRQGVVLLFLTALSTGVFSGCGGPSSSSSNSSAPGSGAHGGGHENAGPPVIAGEPYVRGRTTWIKNCKLCHEDGGEDDAPLLGDQTEWAKRLAKGMPAVTKNAFEGKGMMPARGGRKGISNEDLKAAIEYMVKASQ